MSKVHGRELSVVDKEMLTPNMIRITLGGDSLDGFPDDQESGYVKLYLDPNSAKSANKKKALMRSYTIRSYCADRQELILDFVNHGDTGPASAWARKAMIGETVTISDPGPKKMVDMSAEWFFLVGDMSALPALSVNLEKLPITAKGYAVIEIIDKSDAQLLAAPEGIEIHWVVNSDPMRPRGAIEEKVQSLPWLKGRPFIWLACEFAAMRTLRRYFKEDRAVGKKEIYASSYWKIGDTNEEHSIAKSADALN